ncbi:MAG: ABC transporter ATP-binding protein, partial [Clostridia bacterium]|nr:ABC transporter ATP-binding protein [Clostridia bacterium]
MIEAKELTKSFENFIALDKVSCQIPDGCIYGMVGSNGAGKSTFLRVLAGIYKAEGGSIAVDGMPVYENPAVKKDMMFVPDELFFLPGANLMRMAQFYKNVYATFDTDRFEALVSTFRLPKKKAIQSFSKGMKRQAAILLALSVRPRIMLFDETFDGLDPMMRKVVKSYICNDVAERGATVIITSHSLRELEDICDQLVLLHKGDVVLESDVSHLKTGVSKVQAAFPFEYGQSLFEDLDVVSFEKNGSVANVIVRGQRKEIEQQILAKNPLL